MKQFALPMLGLVVVAGYWLWSSTQPATPPATAAPAKGAATSPSVSSGRDPGADAPRTTPDTKANAGAPTPAVPEPGAKASRRDRKETDMLRTQLRTLHRSSTPPSAADGAAAEPPPPADELDAKYIQARIREDLLPIAQECYESALEDDPKLGGKLVMTFSIVGDPSVGGVVDEADVDPTSEIKQPDLLECMKESMLSLSFPPPEDGGTVQVTYPFAFAAEGPPAKP